MYVQMLNLKSDSMDSYAEIFCYLLMIIIDSNLIIDMVWKKQGRWRESRNAHLFLINKNIF